MLVTLSDVGKSFGAERIFEHINVNINDTDRIALIGPNGAGKTTSFYMVAGVVRPDTGSVMFTGKDVSGLPMHIRARLGMGYLPQEESIFRKLTVEENLMAILETRADLTRKEKKDKMMELLERFHITKLQKSHAIQLSGGEKRRLTIARALASNPKLLMLDEPFAGVDPIAVQDIQNIVASLRETDGLSILITDHNVRETLGIVDRAYILFEGKVIKEGNAEEIANDPKTRKIYLGEDFKM